MLDFSRVARLLLSAALALPLAPTLAGAQAGAAQGLSLGPSGLPLRIGPGTTYPVEWMYLKSGLPMEIVQEYDNWRRVRDAEGTEGWINQSLLSGKRTAIVSPWQRGKDALIAMRADPDAAARVVANLEPGVIVTLRACNGNWCQMDVDGRRGWVEQSQVWGAYPGETIAD